MSPDQMAKFNNENPVGTGPYKFKERKQGQVVSIARNDSWWGTAPAAATVSWTVYTNDDVLAQALKTGDIDIVPQVPPTVFGGIQNDNSLTSVVLDSFSFHHIGINVWADPKSKGNPLLLDRNVRQALGYALDRNQIAQIAYAGQARPGDSILMPTFGDYYWQPTGDQVIDNNPDKANQLLDNAGYTAKDPNGIRQSKDGQPLRFRIIAIDSTSVDVRTAQLFQASAAKVGIKLDFSTVDSDTMASTVYNTDAADWDLFVWGWDSGVNDPSYMLSVPLTSQIGANNDVFYSNPKYDALFLKQASELDHDKRVALVKQMQQMFYEDTAYLVAVYTKKLQAYKGWTNLTEVPGGIVFNFTRDNYLKATPTA
jgi:peptide/nickel transport system substrate-binding protein